VQSQKATQLNLNKKQKYLKLIRNRTEQKKLELTRILINPIDLELTFRNAAAVQDPPPGLVEILFRSANRLSVKKTFQLYLNYSNWRKKSGNGHIL
jgi:hypothetical protein